MSTPSVRTVPYGTKLAVLQEATVLVVSVFNYLPIIAASDISSALPEASITNGTLAWPMLDALKDVLQDVTIMYFCITGHNKLQCNQ